MTTVVLFHHVQGLTEGVRALADQFRGAGHDVVTPDLFDGELPSSIEEGIALAESIPSEVMAVRLSSATKDLPDEVVWAGMSWGVSIAQNLAQTKPGAVGALFYESCLPVRGDGSLGTWPNGLPVQVHGMDDDPFFAHEGDLESARELVRIAGADKGALFTYAGSSHLFTDSSLTSYDPEATKLVVQRSIEFLNRLS